MLRKIIEEPIFEKKGGNFEENIRNLAIGLIEKGLTPSIAPGIIKEITNFVMEKKKLKEIGTVPSSSFFWEFRKNELPTLNNVAIASLLEGKKDLLLQSDSTTFSQEKILMAGVNGVVLGFKPIHDGTAATQLKAIKEMFEEIKSIGKELNLETKSLSIDNITSAMSDKSGVQVLLNSSIEKERKNGKPFVPVYCAMHYGVNLFDYMRNGLKEDTCIFFLKKKIFYNL